MNIPSITASGIPMMRKPTQKHTRKNDMSA